ASIGPTHAVHQAALQSRVGIGGRHEDWGTTETLDNWGVDGRTADSQTGQVRFLELLNHVETETVTGVAGRGRKIDHAATIKVNLAHEVVIAVAAQLGQGPVPIVGQRLRFRY